MSEDTSLWELPGLRIRFVCPEQKISLEILSTFSCSLHPQSAMQEDALKLVLLALEDGSALSRKVLVLFVVQKLEARFPQASKTSIGHVVQLLYRASCFKVQHGRANWHTHYVHIEESGERAAPSMPSEDEAVQSSVTVVPRTQAVINDLIRWRVFK